MDHHDAVTTDAAERYLLDEMSEAERDAFEAHYFDCQPCAADVRQGAAMADALRTSGAGATVVPFVPKAAARPRPKGQWMSIAAAALLALVAGYQAFVVIPGLRETAGAQALAPVVLRPISRGDAPVVPRPEPNALVSLSMDVNLDPLPSELAYRLSSADGREILAGRAPVPAPGTPLLLVLPGRTLTAGQYEIELRGTAGGVDVSRYRFDVR
jgi:hypothetical protein